MFPHNMRTIITLLSVLHIPSSTPLEFNFPSMIPPNPSLIRQGNATYLDSGQLELTRNQTDQIGRVRYSEQFHLWVSKSSGATVEADFTTDFSFAIESDKRPRGDGLAFFLAEPPFPVPRTDGRGLGLVGREELNSSSTRFVAVEFDTFQNRFDPLFYDDHVGINVKSMVSAKTADWYCTVGSMESYNATVTYVSTSKNLSVTFTGYSENIPIQQSLNYEIRLADYLPELVVIGISAANGLFTSRHILNSWSFNSTYAPESENPSIDEETSKTGRSNSGTKLAVVLSIVGGSVLISVICVIYFVWRKKRRPRTEERSDELMDNEFEKSSGARKFSFSELCSATNNFARERKLGEGGFGEVYRGFLRTVKCDVAVKRVSKWSSQGIKEYASEVKIVGRLMHKNLASLLGWCHQKGELLLVYELMANGSLDSYLFGQGDRSLTWEARYNIAQGLASALRYLHDECEKCVLHRDIKPSNVLLDSRLNAKLTDFGLARLVDHGEAPQSTTLAGTRGYVAPECFHTGKASSQSDVYAFGVVALEIASGVKATASGDKSLSEWIWGFHETDMILEAADPKLLGCFDRHQMVRLMIVGLWCSHPDFRARPSIKHVCNVLESEAPLPVLRMPGSGFENIGSTNYAFSFSQDPESTFDSDW